MSEREIYLKSLQAAERALELLRRHELPATPKYFEFWSAYATGINPAFNRAVDQAILARGRLTPNDLRRLHGTYLSPGPLGDRIEDIGGQIAMEIADLSASVEKILADATDYGCDLHRITARLTEGESSAETIAALKGLVDATQRMETGKLQLEARMAETCSRFEALQSNLDTMVYESQNDPLTTLSARKFFDLSIERAVDEAACEATSLSLILTDIDHFKSFNDRYGHQTGDHVLRLVAQSTKQNIKGQDIACRYGGEEFAIILPLTDQAQATLIGEHIRQAVMSRELVKRSTGENLGHVTVSVGVASYRDGDTPQSLIERADACLYAAKRAGRNRVVSESADRPPAKRQVA